jgi:putative Holliday junction resolvase
MNYLGLDVGQKRIGVAVGRILASELTTLQAGHHESFYEDPARTRAYQEILSLLQKEEAGGVVAGLPVKADGNESEESKKIVKFCDGLSTVLGFEVRVVDETLSSFMARDILEGQGIAGQELEARLDQASAALILQQFLEEHASL